MKCILESASDLMTFGRYKGFSISEIFCGNSTFSSELLSNYASSNPRILRRFNLPPVLAAWTRVQNIYSRNCEENRIELEIPPIFKEVFNGKSGLKLELRLNLFDFQEFCLFHTTKPEIISGSPDAVSWYIKKVDGFCINPAVIAELNSRTVYTLYALELDHIKDNVFKFRPLLDDEYTRLPESIIVLNNEKYEYYKNGASANGWKPANTNASRDSGYLQEHSFDQYNGSYAQDIMGFSDQTIDDAFDGDPDVYWNID